VVGFWCSLQETRLEVLRLLVSLIWIKILRVFLEVESEDKGLIDRIMHSRIPRAVIARTVMIIGVELPGRGGNRGKPWEGERTIGLHTV
jgi:hypothetical protein